VTWTPHGKEALEHFLELFLAFFFPAVHEGLDWRRRYESLDKELQQIAHDARTGRRLADKLFKVWRKDGQEAWLLIHVEVQGQREQGFPERMFVYSYRIYDRYRRPVVSLAVLTTTSRPAGPTSSGIISGAAPSASASPWPRYSTTAAGRRNWSARPTRSRRWCWRS
jgi:hypothetical protein